MRDYMQIEACHLMWGGGGGKEGAQTTPTIAQKRSVYLSIFGTLHLHNTLYVR
jgi:hypothetical protein